MSMDCESMDSDDLSAVCLALAVAAKKRKKKRRKVRMKEWLKKRSRYGSFETIFKEVGVESGITDYLRVPLPLFEMILRKIEPLIGRKETLMRDTISSGARLEATLLFLASGMSYERLKYTTRISAQSLGIIPETCEAIFAALKDEHLKVMNTLFNPVY